MNVCAFPRSVYDQKLHVERSDYWDNDGTKLFRPVKPKVCGAERQETLSRESDWTLEWQTKFIADGCTNSLVVRMRKTILTLLIK